MWILLIARRSVMIWYDDDMLTRKWSFKILPILFSVMFSGMRSLLVQPVRFKFAGAWDARPLPQPPFIY